MADKEVWLFWGLLMIQAGGLVGLVASRMDLGRRGERWCQGAFYACLLLVGGATIMALLHETAYWVSSGATFGLMSVGATWEHPSVGSL